MSAQPQADSNLVTIEVDGVEMQAPKGSMIIEATDRAGINIPRFCYHPKLSIAANCRMCLVDVEKAPKPLPACATPVMDGMKVFTRSRRAVDAQHGVMEFLLINHPLDCPICDQGGECELQDLAMGYGRSVSRFTERKRVVKDKNVGPLVQTDMTRCIHCTRCIRFLDEIAGTCEMGGTGRGDRLEIGTGIERSIGSELSGNIIDLCPVGALTNKPFRYSARAWELTARPSVAMHDGIGSQLWYHVRRGEVKRAVPRDAAGAGEGLSNECWLSDRDRYSHFGLDTADRVRRPMVKRDGEWSEATWDEAIAAAADALRGVTAGTGSDLGVLMSPSAGDEEYFLAQRLARGLDCANIDHRLREFDISDDAARPVHPAFEMSTSDMPLADAVLLIGSNIRLEAPILGQKVRQAFRAGGKVAAVNPVDWKFHFDLNERVIVAPQDMVAALQSIADGTHPIAEMLKEGARAFVLVGQSAMSHPQAAEIRALARQICEATGAALNLLPHGGNPVGAWRSGAVPHRGPGGSSVQVGMGARDMLESPRKGYLLWGFEPDFDTANPALTVGALESANTVVSVASYATDTLKQWSDVILPLSPWPESEGSVTVLDGERLDIAPAGRGQGDERPGWKILRRLGAALGLDGFDQVTLQDIREELDAAVADAECSPGEFKPGERAESGSLWRVGEVMPYSADALVRRAGCLQQAAAAAPRSVRIHPEDAARLGLAEGGTARVRQGDAYAELTVEITDRVAVGAAWVPGATCDSRVLGDLVGPVNVEVA